MCLDTLVSLSCFNSFHLLFILLFIGFVGGEEPVVVLVLVLLFLPLFPYNIDITIVATI